MNICTCESCRYKFRYPLLPPTCPDCGKETVRLSTKNEIKEYLHDQLLLREDIRAGLWSRG